jgi:hypothetical protein
LGENNTATFEGIWVSITDIFMVSGTFYLTKFDGMWEIYHNNICWCLGQSITVTFDGIWERITATFDGNWDSLSQLGLMVTGTLSQLRLMVSETV